MTSLDACSDVAGASSDVREAISLHQAVCTSTVSNPQVLAFFIPSKVTHHVTDTLEGSLI